MQVEGAEFQLVPHLIATNATELIDELFLEASAPRKGVEMLTS